MVFLKLKLPLWYICVPQNRYIDNLFNVARLPHDFDTEQHRTVLAVSSHEEVIEQAWQMGVTLATGLDIIKQVQVSVLSVTLWITAYIFIWQLV